MRKETFHYDADFLAGKCRTKTEMKPVTERQVPAGIRAIDIQRVGIRDHGSVAVRRRPEEQKTIAGVQINATQLT